MQPIHTPFGSVSFLQVSSCNCCFLFETCPCLRAGNVPRQVGGHLSQVKSQTSEMTGYDSIYYTFVCYYYCGAVPILYATLYVLCVHVGSTEERDEGSE